MLGYIFIKQACKIRYVKLIQGLDNKYARDQVNSFPISLGAAYKILTDYRQYLDKSKKFYTDVETVVAFIPVKYYNLNPKHFHLTCKNCVVKGHIDDNCEYKGLIYYMNKRENDSENTKSENRGTTNANINSETNQQITPGDNEEIEQSIAQNEKQSQVTSTQFLTVSRKN